MKLKTNNPCLKLLALILGAFLLGSCQKKEESLSLLVWEGYADPSFIHAFEEAHHCKVSASYMGSSDDLVAKLRGGSASNYDVISPSSDVASSIAHTGLAESLDLPNFQPILNSLLNCANFLSSKQVDRLWCAVYVGPQSSALRHHGLPAGPRFLVHFLGSQIQRKDFRLG